MPPRTGQRPPQPSPENANDQVDPSLEDDAPEFQPPQVPEFDETTTDPEALGNRLDFDLKHREDGNEANRDDAASNVRTNAAHNQGYYGMAREASRTAVDEGDTGPDSRGDRLRRGLDTDTPKAPTPERGTDTPPVEDVQKAVNNLLAAFTANPEHKVNIGTPEKPKTIYAEVKLGAGTLAQLEKQGLSKEANIAALREVLAKDPVGVTAILREQIRSMEEKAGKGTGRVTAAEQRHKERQPRTLTEAQLGKLVADATFSGRARRLHAAPLDSKSLNLMTPSERRRNTNKGWQGAKFRERMAARFDHGDATTNRALIFSKANVRLENARQEMVATRGNHQDELRTIERLKEVLGGLPEYGDNIFRDPVALEDRDTDTGLSRQEREEREAAAVISAAYQEFQQTGRLSEDTDYGLFRNRAGQYAHAGKIHNALKGMDEQNPWFRDYYTFDKDGNAKLRNPGLSEQYTEVARLLNQSRYHHLALQIGHNNLHPEDEIFKGRTEASYTVDKGILVNDGEGTVLYPDGSVARQLSDGRSKRTWPNGEPWQPLTYSSEGIDEADPDPEASLDQLESQQADSFARWSRQPDNPHWARQTQKYAEALGQRLYEESEATGDKSLLARSNVMFYWANYLSHPTGVEINPESADTTDAEAAVLQHGSVLVFDGDFYPEKVTSADGTETDREGHWRIYPDGSMDFVDASDQKRVFSHYTPEGERTQVSNGNPGPSSPPARRPSPRPRPRPLP